MARKFGVNPSTIARWASGKNAPHVMVRPIIIDWVSKYVQDEIGKPGSGPINGLNEPAVRGSGVSEVGHAGSPAAASC
jgi:hypothetical protein